MFFVIFIIVVVFGAFANNTKSYVVARCVNVLNIMFVDFVVV